MIIRELDVSYEKRTLENFGGHIAYELVNRSLAKLNASSE